MSQEKVDRYKEYKANKAKILKKEKTIRRLELGAAAVLCAVLIGWVGFSFYAESSDPTNGADSVTEMDATAIDEFITGLSATEGAE